MDDPNNSQAPAETVKPSLEEMRGELKTLTGSITEIDKLIEENQKKRSELKKQHRALLGKIITREAAGEV